MVSFYGDYDTTETVAIPFNTFTSDDPSASSTITDLAATDIHIHKDGGLTQRSSAVGVAVVVNFDSITGNHLVTIDLSDDTDAGFYAAGSRYQVRMEGTTVDGATINAWIGAFSIGRTLSVANLANLASACAAYSATRGLTGTALPAAAADAAGGLPISDAGGLDIDTKLANTNEVTAARMGALTDWIDGGRLDLILDIVAADVVNIDGAAMRGTDSAALATTALSNAIWTDAKAGYIPVGLMPTQAEVLAIQNNTRVRVIVPPAIERPDAGSTTYRLWLYLYDAAGNMEAPDSLPTITAENNTGTDRSSGLSAVTNPSTGVYYADYTVAAAHAIEGLRFQWSVVEGGVTRVHGAQSLVVDTTAVDFTAADRTLLETLATDYTTARAAKIDNLDATVSSRSTYAGADTAGTTTLLARATELRLAELDAANLPTDVAAVKTDTAAILVDTGTDGVVVASGSKTGYALSATGADLITSSSTFGAAMADAVLKRSVATVEASAAEWSLCTVILAMLESSISGTTWTIKRTNGSTTHATKTVTVDAAADPITGVT